MKALTINNEGLAEAISEIAIKENRTPENMAETLLLDFVKDYNG